MAILTNALDAIPIDQQLAYFQNHPDPLVTMAEAGFDPALLDLRRFFGRPQALATILRRHQIIFALGGNSFLLRRAMRDSGFDMIVGDMLREGIVYGGFSAGSCVCGGDMRAIAVMDDPEAKAPGYLTNDPIHTGLGLVPFTIIPHVNSDHPETQAAARALAFAKVNDIPHVALCDGEVIAVHDGKFETLRRRAG